MWFSIPRPLRAFLKPTKNRKLSRSRSCAVDLLVQELESRYAPAADKITTLVLNIPPDVSGLGVYMGMYGQDQSKNGAIYYANAAPGTSVITSYEPASGLQVGAKVPLLTLVAPGSPQVANQIKVDLPNPTPLKGLWGGEIFIFVGTPTTGLVVNIGGTGISGQGIAAPKAMPDPSSPVTPDNFAQFEFTFTNPDPTTLPTPTPLSLDVDSSAVDGTGFPFSLVYPQSTAGFPLNPVGISQTQNDIVVNFASAFSAGGIYAAYPQFLQSGQFNSQQVIAPQDILAEETATPIVTSAIATNDSSIAGLVGSATSGGSSVTLASPLKETLQAGWKIVGANLSSGSTVLTTTPAGATSIPISGSISASGPDVYTIISGGIPLAGVAGSGTGSTITLAAANTALLVGMSVTGTNLAPGTFVTSVSGTSVGLSKPVAASGNGVYTFAGNLPAGTTNYLITAFSDYSIPNSNGTLGETLPSSASNVTVVAGQTVTLNWNEYNDVNTAGYNVYRYQAIGNGGSSEYTLVAHLIGKHVTRFTDAGSVSQSQQNVPAPVTSPIPNVPPFSPITASNFGFNPLSDYYTNDILSFFNHYKTNTFSMNRVGVLWTGNTVSYVPSASWNLTSLSTAVGAASGASSLQLTGGTPLVYPGQVITGAGIAPGTTVVSVAGSTITLSQATTAAIAANAPLTALSTYTVLQLTAQTSSGTINVGDVLNVYQPIFASNTRFVTADGTPNGPPAPPMPTWLAQNFNLYESPAQMVFACNAVFASNGYDPDTPVIGDLPNALGALENSIVSAFNRGIAVQFDLPPDNWASFPQILSYPSIQSGTSSLAAGTYYYEVTAVNPFGETTPSFVVRADVTASNSQIVTLNWANGSAAPAATSYNVYRGSTLGGPLTFLTNTTKTTLPDDGSFTPSPTKTPAYQYFTPGTNSNWYAAYVQSNSVLDPVHNVSINGLSYGFPYSDQGGVSTNLFVANVLPKTITINLGELNNLGFLTQSLPDAVNSQSYTQTILASGAKAVGATFASADLPNWLTLTSAGVLSGTAPATSQTVTFTITATSADTTSTTAMIFTLNVGSSSSVSPLGIAGINGVSLQLPAGEATKPYTATISVVGGVAPYSATQLELAPAGMTLTPDAAGFAVAYPNPVATGSQGSGFDLLIQDSLNLQRSATWTSGNVITVSSVTGLATGMAVSGNGLHAGTVIQSIVANAGVYNLTLVIAVAPGNQAPASNPTSGGTFTFANAAFVNPTIIVNPLLQITTPTTLPNANAGAAYSVQLATNVVDETVLFTGQGLPNWLTLTPNGLLSGTAPATVGAVPSFTITASSPYTTLSPVLFSLTVANLAPLAIQPSVASPFLLPQATLNPYVASLGLSGGDAPYNLKVVNGSLPAGLGLFSASSPGSIVAPNLNVLTGVTGASSLRNGMQVVGPGIPAGTTIANVDVANSQVTLSGNGAAGSGTFQFLALSGTPTNDNSTSYFTVRLTDALGNSVFQGYELVVSSTPTPPPAPKITGGSTLSVGASTLILTGTNFALSDVVTFFGSGYGSGTATVTAASPTQLIVDVSGVTFVANQSVFVKIGSNFRDLGMVLAASSAPTVLASTAPAPLNAPLIISGTNFSSTPSNNIVLLTNPGVTAQVTSASATQLTVQLSGLTIGESGDLLTGSVVVNGYSSAANVNLGTVVGYQTAPTVNGYVNPPVVNANATAITITGTGFNTSGNAKTLVTLYASDLSPIVPNPVVAVTVNSQEQLTVALNGTLSGVVYAAVSVNGVTSPKVAVVTAIAPTGPNVPAVTLPFAAAGTSLVIGGSGFTPYSFAGTSTNASASLTLLSVAGLAAGMQVYGPGIAAGTTIASISSTTLTLSLAAGSGAGGGAFLFTAPNSFVNPASASRSGASTNNSASLTLVNTLGLYAGLEVAGPGIAAGTTILSVNGPTSVTLNTNAGSGAGAGNFTFHLVNYQATVISPRAPYTSLAIPAPSADVVNGMTAIGLGIPAGTTVTNNNGSLTLSQGATGVVQNDNLNVYFFNSPLAKAGASTAQSTQVTVSDTTGLVLGMAVFGPGVAFGTTIAAIGVNSITLSAATSASGVGAGTFAFFTAPSDAVAATATALAGSATLTAFSSTSGLFPGMAVTGPGITAGTTVLSVASGTQSVTLSIAASASSTGGAYQFVAYPVDLSSSSSTTQPGYTGISVDSSDQITLTGLTGLVNGATLSALIGPLTAPTPVASVSSSVPASAPTVTSNGATQANPLTLVINGANFDANGTNVVLLYVNGAPLPLGFLTNTVATSTQLTLSLAGPLPSGKIAATVITDGVTSGAPVQVATVPSPSVIPSSTNLTNTPVLVKIHGQGFDPSGTNVVTFFTDAAGANPIPSNVITSVIVDSPTELTVTLNTAFPLTSGTLYASVVVDKIPLAAAGAPTQFVYAVANLINGGPTIALNSSHLTSDATLFTIAGANFDATSANNVVKLFTIGGELVGAINSVTVNGNQLLVSLNSGVQLPLGQLYATVTTPAALSDKVQVADVVASIPSTPTITGVVPFVGPTTGGNTVVIIGANFTGVTGLAGVQFGGNNATSYTVNSATQITAIAPAGAPATIDVKVTNASGASTASSFDKYTYALPEIESVVMNGGPIVAKDKFGNTPNLAYQNSVVEQILVTFNQPVTLDANAFTITNLAAQVTAQVVTPTPAAVAVTATGVAGAGDGVNGYLQYVLTFNAGAGVNSFTNAAPGNSFTTLMDGFFQLNTVGANVHSGSQTAANRADKFWALYGAVNPGDVRVAKSLGNGGSTLLVDGLALAGVYSTFGSNSQTPAGNPSYLAPYDWNLDGNVDGIDLSHLYANFGAVWNF